MKRIIVLILCIISIIANTLSVSAIKAVPIKGITLDKTQVSLEIGKTYVLKIKLSPANTTQKLMSFATSNKNVATVDKNGKIAAVGAGSAVITVTSTSNKKISVKCSVTVAKPSLYGDAGGLKLPIVDKPVKISWMISSDLQGNNDKPVIKELEKRTGIDLDLQCVPLSSYADKVKIVLASGKLPDILYGISDGDQFTLGAQGALACITDYINILPNFKKLYVDNSDNSWALKSYGNTEGKLYIWPIYDLNRTVNFGWLYRADIFQKNGIKPWTDTESFYQAMKKLKEIYPNSYPVLSKWQANTFDRFSYAWGLYSENKCTYYNFNTKKWQLISTDPQYKAMLDFMKKLYNEKLLDPEFLTCTTASYQAKITADDNGAVAYDWIGWMNNYYNQVKEKNPQFNLKYAVPIGPTGKLNSLRKITSMGLVVAKNARTETTLKLLDYLTSPSGSELITLGILGTEYKMVNNKPVYPELKDMPVIGIMDLETKYGAWLESMYVKVDHRSVYFNFTPNEQEAQDIMVQQKRLEPDPPLPVFTTEESEVKSEYEAAIIKASQEFSANYVMNKDYGDTQWNEWVNSTKKIGGNAVLYVYNAAQKRLNSVK